MFSFINKYTNKEIFMELGIEPIRQYHNQRIKAQVTRHELDTRFYPDDYGEYSYARHLEDTIQKPTVGMLAMQEAKRKPLLDYPYHFERNQKILENKSAEVQLLKKTLNDTIKFLYPRTEKIREFIIEHNRLEFDNIKKSKGYNWFDKLKLFLKK